MRLLARVYFVFAYFFSWLLFGAVGLVLNLVCAPLLLSPNRTRFGPSVRRLIRALFDAWVKWLHACNLMRFEWRGFDAPLSAGTLYAANHPSLVDATFLLARLPDAVCIFKPALLRNPAIGPAARMAGYVAGDTGIDLICDASDVIASGCSLLIFPEGTRTAVDAALNPLKPGFSLIAKRAPAPVQLITIHAPRDLLPKGRPWWRMPRFPMRIVITLDERLEFAPGEQATEFTARVEQRLLAALAASQTAGAQAASGPAKAAI